MLLEDSAVGDYVIVHAGFAIKKLDEESAMETIRLLREAAAFVDNLEAGKG
jgi:hydrogenase expression/formation protein HypC